MKVPTNKISDAFEYYKNLLVAIYDEPECKGMMFQLINHYFGFDRLDFIKNPNYRLSESELLKLHFAVKDLLSNKPLQYILGEVVFLDLKIKVNPDVLIPRPETEELVQIIRGKEQAGNPISKILDIGCGSGCIGISIKKYFENTKVLGIDVSAKALSLAKENASLNNVKVDFVCTDILDETRWSEFGFFDLIVSNPPYVRDSEKLLMHKNVLDFEPATALFVTDADPLLFYRKIAQFCDKQLEKGGSLYFEINEAFGKECKEMLFENNFISVEIIQDVNGKDRFIRALK